ncbi:unnamed protein product [Bursaphelenchus okinawaensis]|uniref:Uncharacterized protein n=1 Tax=Bursaphelenchus okinawaensis TaxID=465554 RepID=A0A811K985_9BILA|nr:unnamed protein product [Bursaphelenchus okinawaensis]CAG9097391.1 unnamed protein product [Bursaphelenchus okinawaensis]
MVGLPGAFEYGQCWTRSESGSTSWATSERKITWLGLTSLDVLGQTEVNRNGLFRRKFKKGWAEPAQVSPWG